jgi:RNA polymerase sigma-70 factor (ECF subfamily)
MSEAQWLESVAGGDCRALERLYLSYHRRLTRFLLRQMPHSENVDEIINDTFMVVWQHAGKFRHASQLSTWIYGIAYRIAMKSLRQRKRWQTKGIDELPEPVIDSDRETEDRDWLAAGLRRLSEDQRLSLLLVFRWGHSVQQVAVMTNCSVGTVKSRLFRARAKMRDHLSALKGGDLDYARAGGDGLAGQ